MKPRPEHLLLFYSSVAGHDSFIRDRVAECMEHPDTDYLADMAPVLGVAGGLTARLVDAGFSESPVVAKLRDAVIDEMRITASMKSLAQEITWLFGKHGIRYIPLKGCDPRISESARGFFNVMQDIDILVQKRQLMEVADVLESEGYRCAGMQSPSHLTFFTDEETPRLIEIHHDLVNRTNPVHSRIFTVRIDAVWERSEKMCSSSLLSPIDLLSYMTAHAVKEFFHKPKWLADLVWTVEFAAKNADRNEAAAIISEWGAAHAIGMVVHALKKLVPPVPYDVVREFGVPEPGFTGKFCADRLISFESLGHIRPLIFLAAAESTGQKTRVAAGIAKRIYQRQKENII